MPNYNAQNPPYSIFPGDLVFPFNAESPAAPQASQQYAIATPFDGSAQQGRLLAWQTSFASAPSAVNVVLQAADVDSDADYAVVDTSTQVAGERRQILVKAKFVRVRLVSQTGGGAITVSLS